MRTENAECQDGKQRAAPPLPPTFTDKLFGGLADSLPEWVADTLRLRSSQRQLLLLERRVQRRFLLEYRAQVKALEPVLRQRGEIVGQAILDAFLSNRKARVAYEDAEGTTATLEKSVMEVLDPLLKPVLAPFVEGLKVPLNAQLGEVERDVRKVVWAAAGVGLVAGVILGRLSPGSGRDR